MPPEHPSFVGAMRAAAMTEADLVLVIGRELDYQMGYGSPAVFPQRAFRAHRRQRRRVARQPPRRSRNCWPRPRWRSTAIVEACGEPRIRLRPRRGRRGLRERHVKRSAFTPAPLTQGDDGKVHPAAIFDAIREVADRRLHRHRRRWRSLELCARRAFAARTYMDAGAFGCLGVGVPFAIAAALWPNQRSAGDFGQRRRRLRHQRHGDRHGGAPRRQRLCSSSPTTRPGTSSATIRNSTTAAASSARRCGTPITLRLARALGAHGERVERAEDLAGGAASGRWPTRRRWSMW